MPEYPYECPLGHETDLFFHMTEDRPRIIPCPSCGLEARKTVASISVGRIVNEHFNESLGCVVKGSRHLRQLQKENSCHDYEPIRKRTAAYLGDRNPEIKRAKEAQAAAAALGDERSRTRFRDDPAESVVFNGGA